MRGSIASLLGLVSIASATGATSQQLSQTSPTDDFVFEHAAKLNAEMVYWRSREGDAGLQVFAPLDLLSATTVTGDTRIDLGIRSAYIFSESYTPNFQGHVSTVSDTVVKVQAAYEGWQTFQPFALLNVNLPTGKETLRGAEKNAVMDRDLVPQTRFGEGWNINPGVGVTIPLTDLVAASAGVSYNFRRAYVPDGDLEFRYDPGDQWIATLGLTYVSQSWLATLHGIWTRETTSTLESLDYFKPGDGYTASATLAHLWDDRNTSSLSFQFNHTRKNNSMNLLTGTFGPDDQNSNSNLYIASLSHHYSLSHQWKLFGQFTYLKRTANLFDEVSDFYVPAKDKYLAEVGVALEAGPTTALFSAGYLHLEQDKTPYLGAQTYRGVVGRASVQAKY